MVRLAYRRFCVVGVLGEASCRSVDAARCDAWMDVLSPARTWKV